MCIRDSIIGVEGEIFKTNKGELTVRVSTFRILTKALRPLPDKHKGLNDTELRYRKRYVDLIVNEESRHVFEVRSKIIRSIRNYFESADFMEVETPMMQVIPGGATARPFTTHHNALNQDMYLNCEMTLEFALSNKTEIITHLDQFSNIEKLKKD